MPPNEFIFTSETLVVLNNLPLKAVSPFIAHGAAIITIPLLSFFRDKE